MGKGIAGEWRIGNGKWIATINNSLFTNPFQNRHPELARPERSHVRRGEAEGFRDLVRF